MPRGIYLHKPLSMEHKEHIREALKGREIGNIWREKISKALKGQPSPRKGKHLSEKTKRKLSKALEGNKNAVGKGTGFKKGNIPWNKGKKCIQCSGENNSFYGKHHTKESIRKMSEAKKGRKLTKEHIKNTLRRRIPSSLEEEFQKIVDKHNLPYKYVGNGSFFIERYNPDFINTNSEKIAIEVYARFYKLRCNKSIEIWKKERTKVFKKYGWSIIYFDETQVKEDYVLSILNEIT